MYADNSGSIDLDMDNNSVFTGSTALANSGTINLNLKITVTGMLPAVLKSAVYMSAAAVWSISVMKLV